MGRILGGIAVGLLAAAPLLSQAQNFTYRCTGSDGKKYYGSAVPMQCSGRLVEVLNSSGMVIKRIDQVAEEKARAAKAAASASAANKGPEQSIAERDQERRNRALLATCTSVKDIEDARQRALRENAQQAGRFEQKISELKSRRGRYEKELATYKKDGKASTTVEDNIKNVDLEIRVQDELLISKRKEVDGINAKYDQDKQRYSEALAAKNK
jgi:ferritin-like metal-binding protein YciE